MVTVPDLEGFLKKHKKVGIDSNILIYFIEAHPVFQPLTSHIFKSIEEGKNIAVCSALSLMEVLVQPYRKHKEDLVNQFYALLTTYPNLNWGELTIEIADLGARLRAKYQIKTPDAILIATALNSKATGFVGNDLQLKRVSELEVLVLS